MARPIATCAVVLALLGGSGFGTQAQPAYPTRTITMVVPFAAGGPTDVPARLVAQHMSQTLGQQVVVENITGAGGSIGSARVAKAAPDGYSMVMGNLGTHSAAMGLYKNLAYDPRVDFEPVMLFFSTPMVLVTKKDLPVTTLNEVIALGKQRRLSVGHAGIGSISHLTTLLFAGLTNTEVNLVPYRGLSQSVNDLLSGQLDFMFDQAVSAGPHIAAKSVKPIVVTIPKRSRAQPDVPSAAEAGWPKLETTAWTALFLPKGTPRPVVERVHAAMDQALNDPGVAKRMSELGADLPASGTERSAQALGSLVRSEVDKWVSVLKAASVEPQ
jgi:tripartite-type tricarboxylate transporter receptor subunit TctC